jgi:hypothetical protein
MLPVSPVLEVGVEISTTPPEPTVDAPLEMLSVPPPAVPAPLVIERLPPASSVPAFIEILPALEDAGAVSPVEIDMLPDDPDEVDESPVDRTSWPVVTSSEPEAPDVLSPVVTLIVPDDDVPCPEETSTSPPRPPAVTPASSRMVPPAQLASVDAPAVIVRLAPLPEVACPTDNAMPPPTEVVALPERTQTEPEVPELEIPVEIASRPLPEVAPPPAVAIVTLPLSFPAPEDIDRLPPCCREELPAASDRGAPAPLIDIPTEIITSPASPAEESPDAIAIDPEAGKPSPALPVAAPVATCIDPDVLSVWLALLVAMAIPPVANFPPPERRATEPPAACEDPAPALMWMFPPA